MEDDTGKEVKPTTRKDEDSMAEEKATAPKKTVPLKSESKTVTLTFEGKDMELYNTIKAIADDEERSLNVEVLRFLRKNFSKPQSIPSA